MANPKTWDFVGGFVTCLQSILVANGYFTDAGSYVTREPTQIPETQAALIAVALEGLARAADPAMRTVGRLATVVVVGKVPIDQEDAQIRLHELIDDIERCLRDQLSSFPAGTQWPQFIDAKVIPPAEGMSWIGAELRYSGHVSMR